VRTDESAHGAHDVSSRRQLLEAERRARRDLDRAGSGIGDGAADMVPGIHLPHPDGSVGRSQTPAMRPGATYHAQVHISPSAFDLRALFELRGLWETLDPSGTPSIASLSPPGRCRNVALLPGSFNPPTAAHMLLGERALREGFDCVMLLLARNTVGKQPSGLIPEDRLLTMRAASNGVFAVAATSHGLYADQAEAAAAIYPDAELTFLVGSDKVAQIFEPHWYADRTEALERLFDRARLVVAPRSDQGDMLRDVLAAPENRRWSKAVEVLRLHPAVSDLSSTRVRGLLRSGAEPAGLVPSAVADLLSAMRAFAPPIALGNEEVDAYGMRARLIDLCWTSRSIDPSTVDIRAVIESSLSPTQEGARLRASIWSGAIRADEIARAHVSGL